MRFIHFHLYAICCWCLLLCACQTEEEPTSFLPEVSLQEASQITRNQALLQGSIQITGAHTTLDTLLFRYGTTPEMTEALGCSTNNLHPKVLLQELTANTTYYYCLETGNGFQTVRSQCLQFTTLPNERPTLGKMERISQGPQSVTVVCSLLDNGGDTPSEVGFYYTAKNGQEQKKVQHSWDQQTFQTRITGLETNMEYTLQAFAKNSMGECRSESMTIRTSNAVTLSEAGTLPELLEGEERYKLTVLQVAGPINGTDLHAIRDLLGQGDFNRPTPGKLQVLNLTDATICEGGIPYNGILYTQANTVGKDLFANCLYLRELLLPENAETLEREAVEGCPLLSKLYLPTSIQEVAPSNNCPNLVEIKVSPTHPVFRTFDGVLYNRQQTCLIWAPEGKTSIQFPNTLQKIGAKAFRNCRVVSLKLPDSISRIEEGAFFDAKFQEIVLPKNIKLISNGLFQNCRHLTKITLSAQTEYLDDYCFNDCPLQHLYVPVKRFPPHCTPNAFQSSLFTSCTLHVPAEYKTTYQNAIPWNQFEKLRGDCPCPEGEP